MFMKIIRDLSEICSYDSLHRMIVILLQKWYVVVFVLRFDLTVQNEFVVIDIGTYGTLRHLRTFPSSQVK